MTGMRGWEQLGERTPDELVDARLELHWAAQIPAAVGNTLIEARPDWTHLAFTWDDELQALVSADVPGKSAFRAGIRPIDLELFLVDGTGRFVSERSLVGCTLDEGLAWTAGSIAKHTGRPPEELVLPDHVLPEHPTGSGEPFSFREPAEFEELARWFANADRLLREVKGSNAGASPVVCWPHHFDIATLIALDPGVEAEKARTVGVGMSPGDDTYPEPYFYVTPWPYPEGRPLPDLAGGGRWHVEGWTGAVLNGTRLVGASDQAELARAFLGSAVRESMALLNAGG